MLEMLVVPASSREFAQQSVNVFRAGEGEYDHTGMSGRNLAVSDLQSQICGCVASRTAAAVLEGLKHDPEKWLPVFRKDHAQTKR
jgi:hypothetical protein